MKEDNNREQELREENNELDVEEMKSSLGSKMSNFWYFYKWQTIVGVILVIGIIVSLLQLADNTTPDAAIMYVGPSYLTVTDKKTIGESAQTYMIDYNGDGEKVLNLLDINVVTASGELAAYAYQMNAEAQKRFTTEVVAGDSLIYILEKSFYDILAEQNCLAKLSDVLDADMIPEGSDEYGAQVKDLPFFTQEGFSSFPDDAYVCIRSAPDDSKPNYGRTLEYWNSNRVLFRSVFAYRSK